MTLRLPKIIAHRGASADAPENTLAAFDFAWQQEADGIEADFRLTKDRKIVCIHDATTGRTAGTDLTVSESTFRQLRKLDTGSWKGNEWAGEQIPSIEEVFSIVPAGKKIFIEIKCGIEIIGPLSHEILRSKLKPKQIIAISFDENVISQVKKQIPYIKALWLLSIKKDKEAGEWSPSIEHILRVLGESNANGLSVNAASLLSPAGAFNPASANTGTGDFSVQALTRLLRENKKEFHVWNVNDLDTAFYFQKLGVDFMTTDRPKWLRERLSRPSPST